MTAAPEPIAIEEPAAERDVFSFLTSVAVMVALLAAIEVMYRNSPVDLSLRKGVSHLALKEIEFASLGGDVVVTGNSRMYHAFKPSVMTESLRESKGKVYTGYNFAIPSGSPPMFLMVANEAARHKPPPRLFILAVVPSQSSCCDELALAGAPNGMTPSAIPLFVNALWYANPEDAGLAVFLGSSHLLAGRNDFLAAVKELRLAPPMSFHDRGFYALGRTDSASQDVRARGRAPGYADAMDKSKGATIKLTPHRYLAESIRVLQRAGVKVVLLGAPQARQLDDYHDHAHTYFEYLDEIAKLSKKYDVPFVDMNAPPVISNADFVDGDHLSDPGAAIFTKYLTEQVVARYLP